MSDDIAQFDLIVVGSGSGNSIPDYLADWKVAVVERGTFGGTCLNVGCIPSKMFVLPADVAVEAGHADRLGIDVRFEGADWPAIRDRIFGRIDAISEGGRKYRATGSPNVTLIEGTARFVGDRVLDVEGELITAPHIMLAAGTRPVAPPIPGLPEAGYHTSDTIMRLDRFPDRLGVIGGGYIAAEMGHVFAGLGGHVSLFNRSNALLRSHDRDVSERFTELFGARPDIDLHLGHLPTNVERRGDVTVVHCHDGVVEVDELLVATGREPNSDLLDVDAGGVDCHHHGIIAVDEMLRTSAEGVWAIGDIANPWQLKHVANREAATAFWNIAHPDDMRPVDHKAVPAAVFSNPQVASVGVTEQQAEEGVDHVVGRRDYSGTAYGWALADETSFAKVLVDRSGLIIGAHILGPQASTLIQPLVQAMRFDQTARELADGPYWIHPALTEVVENALLDAIEQL